MQVLTGNTHNVCHALDGSGAYEWWYVDALSDDGQWGVVFIVFRGMPMSPSYLRNPEDMNAGCAVSIYHRGTRIAFSFTEQPLTQASYDELRVDVHMKGASLSIDEQGVLHAVAHVPCDADGRSIELHITGAVSHGHGTACVGSDLDLHAWILAQPRMRASIDLALYENRAPVVREHIDALAYHDHNMGRRAMHEDFCDWYWGRVHTNDSTIVFLSTPNSCDAVQHVYEVDAHGTVSPWSDISFDYQARAVSTMGLVCSKNIVMRGVSLKHGPQLVECRNTVTCEDSPFYQRYVSEWVINGSSVALGMSEYMNVARMNSSWIRPFLGLPLVTLKNGVLA